MEILTTWGSAIGIFIVTGVLMQALNGTIGGKAGDHGLKGVWYVWKRFFLLPLGAGLGIGGFALGMTSPIGQGMGYSIVDGIVAAFVAGQMYDLIVGSLKAKARHRLARESEPPPAVEK